MHPSIPPGDRLAPRHLDRPSPAPIDLHWPFGPLTTHQLQRRAAQEAMLRSGRTARWPAGLVHLQPIGPGVQ